MKPCLLNDKGRLAQIRVEERWFGSHLDLRLSMCTGISQIDSG